MVNRSLLIKFILGKIIAYIPVYTLFQRIETVCITSMMQFAHVGLCIILVLLANIFRHIYVNNIWLHIKRRKSFLNQVIKRPCLARTEIVKTIFFWIPGTINH